MIHPVSSSTVRKKRKLRQGSSESGAVSRMMCCAIKANYGMVRILDMVASKCFMACWIFQPSATFFDYRTLFVYHQNTHTLPLFFLSCSNKSKMTIPEMLLHDGMHLILIGLCTFIAGCLTLWNSTTLKSQSAAVCTLIAGVINMGRGFKRLYPSKRENSHND